MVEVDPSGAACAALKRAVFQVMGSKTIPRSPAFPPVFTRYKLLYIERFTFAALRVRCQARIVACHHPSGEATLVQPRKRPGEFAGIERGEHNTRTGGDPPRVDECLEHLL